MAVTSRKTLKLRNCKSYTKVKKTSVCIHCHKHFSYLDSAHKPLRVYCSENCKAKARYKAKSEWIKEHGSEDGFHFVTAIAKVRGFDGKAKHKDSLDEFGNYIHGDGGYHETVTIVRTRGSGNFYANSPSTRIVNSDYSELPNDSTDFSSTTKFTPAVW